MISGRDDHYFGELKALIGGNKCRCRGFFVGRRTIFCGWGSKIILSGTRDSLKKDTFYLGGGGFAWRFSI
jgi:hypothetical protein